MSEAAGCYNRGLVVTVRLRIMVMVFVMVSDGYHGYIMIMVTVEYNHG